MTTYLSDLIHLPERVTKSDFVVRLSDSLEHGQEVLDTYVVTPALAKRFEEALGLIGGAITGKRSQAAFLHGSFGSGKSHFMAVLRQLLAGRHAARSRPELAGAIDKHQSWLNQAQVLMVGIHMLDENDLVAAIFRQASAVLARAHPDADPPPLWQGEALIRDAAAMRRNFGDAAFFAHLNQRHAGPGDGWGQLAGGWTAHSFEAALARPANDPERLRLITDLTATLFTSYRDVKGTHGEAYLPLDDGLAVLTRHCQALGYSAIVLFLDELILWLASRAADRDFVAREGNKLVKLVEATETRPIPVVSLIARQRDLHELIGDTLPGIDKVRFSDILGHHAQRFNVITLEDRDLPEIAAKRLLRPKSDAAAESVRQTVERLARDRNLRDGLIDKAGSVERGVDATVEAFRKTYPFSPALVATLIAVSSALQRERTALRLMAQMLADRRETLTLGEIIPVGDLWDPLADGAEPFSQELRGLFEDALGLWSTRLRPLLDQTHGIDTGGDPDAPRPEAWINDARLLKTLLLAALAPEVAALKDMTVNRLAALNYGAVKSTIPGREGGQVRKKLQTWAAQAGELMLSAETDAITLKVSGVDTDGILEKAQQIDTLGERLRQFRRLLAQALFPPADGRTDRTARERDTLIAGDDQPAIFSLTWRNTPRSVALKVVNLRDADHKVLVHDDNTWQVLIDYPFDEEGHGPREDVQRLQKFGTESSSSSRTLCWLSSHFSDALKQELGRLVILEHVLSNARFEEFGGHLSPEDRAQAKGILDNRRRQITERLRQAMKVAYGLEPDTQGFLSATLETPDLTRSLLLSFQPPAPGGATLKDALERFVEAALAHEYPAAPQFEVEPTAANLRAVQQALDAALAWTEPGGYYVRDPGTRRLLRGIAGPLKLGTIQVNGDRFQLGRHWIEHVQTRQPAWTDQPIRVAEFQRLLDDPLPMGLPREAANLITIVFAKQTDRVPQQDGLPVELSVSGRLADDIQLVPARLPDEETWATAIERAERFGIPAPGARTATQVRKLETALANLAKQKQSEVSRIEGALPSLLSTLEIPVDPPPPRLVTIRSASALLQTLDRSRDPVGALAAAPLETSPAAVARTVAASEKLATVLSRPQDDKFFGQLANLDQDLWAQGEALLRHVRAQVEADEHDQPLAEALERFRGQARDLVFKQMERQKPPNGDPRPGGKGRKTKQGSWKGTDLDELQTQLAKDLKDLAPNAMLSVTWTITEPADQT